VSLIRVGGRLSARTLHDGNRAVDQASTSYLGKDIATNSLKFSMDERFRLLARGRTDRPFCQTNRDVFAAYTFTDSTDVPRVLIFKLEVVGIE
jgi:hypothetical protein